MWLVWRRGYPDPSRLSPAVHFDNPAKDRKDGAADRRVMTVPIAPNHRELSLRELVRLDPYAAPAWVETVVAAE